MSNTTSWIERRTSLSKTYEEYIEVSYRKMIQEVQIQISLTFDVKPRRALFDSNFLEEA